MTELEAAPLGHSRDARIAATRYDAMSVWYRLAARSEAPLHGRAMNVLAPTAGENVLEIGPGTGEVLAEIGKAVEGSGSAIGLDVSAAMLGEARRHARDRGVGPVNVVRADGAEVPLAGASMDAVLMCFSLERFATETVPRVLAECVRVLRPGGRLVVASLADQSPRPAAVEAYLWAHRRFPQWIDCRPIDLTALVAAAGLSIEKATPYTLWGLPVDVVRAEKPSADVSSR